MLRSRLSSVTLIAIAAALPACRPPDPTPLRAALAADAEIVCQSPPARPPHAASLADAGAPPTSAQIQAAAVDLCVHDVISDGPRMMQVCSAISAPDDACRAELAASAPAFAVIHAALLESTALVGDVRRNTLFFAPSIDLSHPERLDPATMASAAKASIPTTDDARRAACVPDRLHVERLMLADAQDRLAHHEADAALDRCADVAALARESI